MKIKVWDDVREQGGYDAPNPDSLSYAVKFAKLAVQLIKSQPVIDLHPDGEVSLTWRRAKNGIINIAFGKDGIATYAAYLVDSEQSLKSRFRVSGSIPSTLSHLIHQIEKT